MFLHNKRMMHTVRVDTPDPRFAKLLLEQFGGANGGFAAALRYFTQGWTTPIRGGAACCSTSPPRNCLISRWWAR